uniref:DNA-directed DNA polymerase n=1 Tax=candidate division WOR-3 bacterium TaxID=2052148 RepID=A0A7C1NE19_UNCW3
MPAGVLDEIRQGRVRPVYIFLGADLTVSDEVVAELKKRLLAPGLEAFDYDSVNAGELGRSEGMSLPMFLQRLNQPPLAARRRLVVIRHLELLGNRLLEEFCAGLKAVPDFVTVVVVGSGEQSKIRELRRMFSEAGLTQWVIAAEGAHADSLLTQVECWAKGLGLELEREASMMLIEIAGEDPVMLKGEIEKLKTALNPAGESGSRVKVTVDCVRQYASSTRVFELRDYVWQCLDRRPAEALSTLRRLEALGEEPKKIIGWLAPALLDLLAVKRGEMAPVRLWRCSRNAPHKWQLEEIDRALEELFRVDLGLLLGNREVFAMLDLWTVRCCGARIRQTRAIRGSR